MYQNFKVSYILFCMSLEAQKKIVISRYTSFIDKNRQFNRKRNLISKIGLHLFVENVSTIPKHFSVNINDC